MFLRFVKIAILFLISFSILGCMIIDGPAYPELTQEELKMTEEIKEALIEDSRHQIVSKMGEENFQKYVRFDQAWTESGLLFRIDYYLNYDLAGIQVDPDQLDKGASMVIYYNPEGQLYSMMDVPDCVTHPEYCPPYRINTYLLAVEEFQKKCPAQNFTLRDYTEGSNTYTEVWFSFDEEKVQWNWQFFEKACGDRGCFPIWTATLDLQTGDLYPVPQKWANGSIAARAGEGFLC